MKEYEYISITANQAFQNANHYNDNIIKSITKDIIERIRAASDNGKYAISIRCDGNLYSNMNDDNICDKIISYFQKYGFCVTKTYDYKTMVLKIEWYNNKDNN